MGLLIITEVPVPDQKWWDHVLSNYGPMWLLLIGGALFLTGMTWKLGNPILNWFLESTAFYRSMKESMPKAIDGMREWSGGTTRVLEEIREDVKDVKRAVKSS